VAGLSAASIIMGTGVSAAHAAPKPSQPNTRVIVLLKDSSAQQKLIKQVSASGGSHILSYQAVPSFAATVSASEAAALAADPAVDSIIPDTNVTVTPPSADQALPGASKRALGTKAKAATPPPNVCSTDPKKPLAPEDLTTTHAAQVQASGIDGSGVTVAYIADGVDPSNADFQRKPGTPAYKKDGPAVFTSYQDFSGEGAYAPTGGEEAFGDASMIAAQGNQTYDLGKYVNPAYALPKGCYIKVLGMAPGANIVGLKAGGQLISNSSILQSIDYAISHHVNVLNESFGANVYPDNSARDTVQRFNDAAVRHGVTVTVSTGDAGVTGTQGSPSTDPLVISVGASTDFQMYQQTGYGAARFSAPGKWISGNISALSSGGISQGGQVPDLVAPGEGDWALCSPDLSRFSECTDYNGTGSPVAAFGGTSEAAPVTAGAAALVIQAYRTAHHGQSPSPALVKKFLTSTAYDLGLPAGEQGTGMLNVQAAVQAATEYRGTPSQVLISPNQSLLKGAPGARVGTGLTVTNAGGKTVKVTPGTRGYATTHSEQQSVSIDPKNDPTFPYATNGVPWAYRKVTFKVAKGTKVLDVSTAWQGVNVPQQGAAPLGPVVRLTLIDPNHAYAANSRPQGASVSANHAYVDVRQPVPGTWTAILYTPAAGHAQSYSGKVIVSDSTQVDVPDGSVSPSSLTLKPGQSGHFTLHTRIKGDHGDASESVTVTSSAGQHASVPIVLRPVIPISHGKGSFTGTITGGNARGNAPTQTLTYAFDVPGNQHDLGVGIRLTDSRELVEGLLIDPDGELIDTASNARGFTTTGTPVTGKTLQNTVTSPEAGQWRFVLLVANPVSGFEISQHFAGSIRFNQVRVTGKLPAKGTRLKAGQKATFTLKYANSGVAPVPVQVDPRLSRTTDVPLAPLFSPATINLPVSITGPFPPSFLVPPGTRSISSTSVSSEAAQLELSGPAGEPDVYGPGQKTSSTQVTEAGGRHVVAPGFWGTFVQVIGPFPKPAPAGTSTVTAVAHTKAFDPAVTSPTGDPYAIGVTGNLNAPQNPVVVNPGKSGSIKVTFTPSGKKGQVVSGLLYLVTSPSASYDTADTGAVQTSGDVLAAIPYTYTVG
jgi:hypothetical protein